MKKLFIYTLLSFSGIATAADSIPTIEWGSASEQSIPEGSTVIYRDGDTTIQQNQDGSKIITKPDGSATLIMRDGTKIVKDAHGFSRTIEPNESKKNTNEENTNP